METGAVCRRRHVSLYSFRDLDDATVAPRHLRPLSPLLTMTIVFWAIFTFFCQKIEQFKSLWQLGFKKVMHDRATRCLLKCSHDNCIKIEMFYPRPKQPQSWAVNHWVLLLSLIYPATVSTKSSSELSQTIKSSGQRGWDTSVVTWRYRDNRIFLSRWTTLQNPN